MTSEIQRAKLLIVASPWLGGSGSVAFRIAAELVCRQYEVHLLSYDTPFKQTPSDLALALHKVADFNYPLFPFPLCELALAEDIVEIVLRHDIHIIHAHYGILFGHAAIIAQSILASRNHPVKVIVTFHGTDVVGFDLDRRGEVVPKHLNRWTIQSADEITVATNHLKEQLLSLYQVERDIRVIPNFVDTHIFKRGIDVPNRKRLIHISNFRKVKQPLVVAKIFERVVSIFPDAELVLIGDGPEKENVLRFVEDNNIPHVSFAGIITDEREIAEHLQNAHLLLLPSLFENFPLSALEAQACGVPVIASNAGGIPEVVLQRKTGYLSQPDDIDDFARNAGMILGNERQWQDMSRYAEEHGRKYAASAVIDQYVELYESC